jgi:hypothetical protein
MAFTLLLQINNSLQKTKNVLYLIYKNDTCALQKPTARIPRWQPAFDEKTKMVILGGKET